MSVSEIWTLSAFANALPAANTGLYSQNASASPQNIFKRLEGGGRDCLYINQLTAPRTAICPFAEGLASSAARAIRFDDGANARDFLPNAFEYKEIPGEMGIRIAYKGKVAER